MAVVDGGTIVGRTLQEQGVKYLFAINGGHIFPILANLNNHGVKLIHMRHEQATAFAADGWARTTGTPGVCSVTAGCGLTNAITGLCVAGLTNSSVVCIAGQHPTLEDGIGSFQEAYGSDICRSFTKYAKRVLDWPRIGVDLRMAFREASLPPQGPALVEIPANILYQQAEEASQFPGAKVYDPGQLRSAGNPPLIDEAVELLVKAERPLLVGGDGVFWSGAAAELRELAERTHTPVYTRRAAQGAVAEDHPLAIRGAWKKPFTGDADLIITVSFRFWSGEKFGQPPTWNGKAKYIQIDATPARIGGHVPAHLAIVGDPKLVLGQMRDAVKQREAVFASKASSPWVQKVAEARRTFQNAITDREAKVRGDVPIHPDRLIKDLVDALDPSSTAVIDSFTLSGYMSHWFPARFPGQIVDAGPLAPVGHGIGMAIGVQLARPGKPVVTIIGDGGIGIGGFDLETAARYKLPIVAVLWNNSSWGPSFDQMPILKGRTDPFNMLENIRYDRVFAEMGCHGENVESPDAIRPAIERALNSGKPAVINVIGDSRIGHPGLGGNLLGSTQV